MSRPAWPKSYRFDLGAIEGDHIRHVVRNATLSRALQIEYNKYQLLSQSERKRRFSTMASRLGLNFDDSNTIDQIVPGIYKLIYLNRDNLFAGDGPTNQIIGLSADNVRILGEQWISQGDDEIMDLGTAENEVRNALNAHVGKIRTSKFNYDVIVGHIMTIVCSALRSLASSDIPTADLSAIFVPAQEVGDLIADIGLNLGFDLIDGRTEDDMNDIAERQERLLTAEQNLHNFIDNNGVGQSLTAILGSFMGY